MTPKIDLPTTNKTIELANLLLVGTQISPEQLQQELESTIEYVSQISKINTQDTPETHQVTGLTNIFREDVVTPEKVLTQKQALSNSPHTHEGYVVVDALLEV
jgi:aspartyl-tRNA(Asn)/glutamyl-tRNA(Gln) amidotransferase subunit C